MTERDWLARVWAMAEAFGWRCWHVAAPMRHSGRHGGFVPDARGSGLPDLVLLHSDPPRMIVAELKGTGGKVSDRQREFLTLARAVSEETRYVRGGDSPGEFTYETPLGVFCWRPEDEPIVEQILRSRVLA